MYHEGGTTVVRKRMGFLSVTIVSVTAIIVTCVVSASGIAIYGLKIFNEKADGLVGLVGEAARSLPEIREGLPPALTDSFDDVRKPEYVDQLDVSVRLAARPKDEHRHWRSHRVVVEVANRGDALVSLLCMRVVGLDEDGDPVLEENVWVATPLQIDDDWRGPILPHETRQFSIYSHGRGDVSKITHEITDIRIWEGPKTDQTDGPDLEAPEASLDL